MADDGSSLSGIGGGLMGMSALAGPAAPIVGGIGLGLELFGGIEKQEGAQKQTAAQIAEITDEEKQDSLRRTAMEVSGRRQQMQVLRNAQQAKSLALQNATNEGAQFGSGLQGGYSQIAGQSGNNLLGINQNLQSGEQMFDLNAMISQQKINYAQAGGQINMGTGISSLGSGLMSSMGALKTLGVSGGVGSAGGGIGGGLSSGGGFGLGS